MEVVPLLSCFVLNVSHVLQVEEVNQNFYEYLAIPSDATTSEVKKAYRRLSLVLHPDRNDADDAELKFRCV